MPSQNWIFFDVPAIVLGSSVVRHVRPPSSVKLTVFLIITHQVASFAKKDASTPWPILLTGEIIAFTASDLSSNLLADLSTRGIFIVIETCDVTHVLPGPMTI